MPPSRSRDSSRRDGCVLPLAWAPPEPDRRRARLAGGVVESLVTFGIYLLAIGLIWGSIALHLRQEHRQLVRHGLEDAANLARGFEENVGSAFTAVDQALVFMRFVYAGQHSVSASPSWARSSAFLNSQTLQMSVADRDGVVLQSNLGQSNTVVSIADRGHFLAQRDASNTDQIFISRPLLGRVSHRLTLNVTRKRVAADGSFDGVVVVSFSPEYLNAFYGSLQIGSGRLTIAGNDGIIRARAPDMPQIDQSLPIDPQLRALTTMSGERQSLLPGGEGGGRVVATRHVRGFPLVVIVELPLQEVLAVYWQDRRSSVLVGTAVSAIVTAIWLLLLRARRRAIRSRQRVTLALQSITQGLMMVDAQRRIATINRRAIDLLGLPPELAVENGSFDAICDWQDQEGEFGGRSADGEDRAMFLQARQFMPESGVYERVRSNGTALEIRTTLLPDGSAVRTYTDITTRRQHEASLRAARDAAEAGSRARSEFLAVMSHEIRTPLNGILGVAALLAERPLVGEDAEHVQIIQQSGEHLVALTNDILDFSKLEAKRMELERTSFDLSKSLHGVMRLLRPQAEQKGLAFGLDIAPDVPDWVEGDGARVGQVVLNLVGNGIKFTAHGRVDLRVRNCWTSAGDHRLRFEVQDSGIGISVAARDKLFKVFTQVDQTISRRFGGSGLGLAICQRIVELMDGEIGVDSEADKGSVFWFIVSLPACRPPVSAPSREIVSNGPFRILLAEDNAVNRLVATRLLTRRGHDVDTAEDSVQALDALSAKSYDLLLTDVMMPEMDGLELTRRVRALPGALSRLPIIGLTAKSGELDVEECIAAGMDGHVAKPIVPDTLERMIHAAMDAAFVQPASNEPPPDTACPFAAQTLVDLTEAIGAEGVADVLALFRAGIDPTVGLLRRLVAEGDMTALTREVHALASSARSVGLDAVGAAAKTLEQDLIAGRVVSAAFQVESIASLIVRDMHWLSEASG